MDADFSDAFRRGREIRGSGKVRVGLVLALVLVLFPVAAAGNTFDVGHRRSFYLGSNLFLR